MDERDKDVYRQQNFFLLIIYSFLGSGLLSEEPIY
jgi:hypothetical protein